MNLEIENKKKLPKQEHVREGSQSTVLNKLLWLVAILILAGAIFGNNYLQQQFNGIVSTIIVFISFALALLILSRTTQGKKAIVFLKEAKLELRKIVWPTRKETIQTTIVVMVITSIVSLILWGFDSIILLIVNFLIGLRF